MEIYRVTFQRNDEPPLEHMVSAAPQIIGRATKADIVLAGDSVSRRHAKVYVEEHALYIEDLQSSNGVIVNGERVSKSTLCPDDLVRIGNYTLRAQLLDSLAKQKYTRRTEIEYSDVAPIHEELLESENSSVSFLYRVSQCLCTQRLLGPLLEGVLDAVMEGLPAERGFILSREIVSEPVKLHSSRIRVPREPETPVSHTLIDHVVRTQASVLTTDASQDDRFENSASIAEHEIKAVICVPLSGPNAVYGVIYVDSNSMPVPLTQKHLKLLSIVGQIVGAGIENIILNDKQIRQVRLAGIGEAVSGTSHDMRNIMMGISGGTEMIEYACDEEDWVQARDGVRILATSLKRFKALSESLLTYARVTELRLAETDPNELISEVLDTVEAEAKKRLIELRYESRALNNVLMDSQQMYRVLLNLVRNAMESMEGRDGEICIESGSKNGAPFILVRDRGRGINPDHLGKIGQPFFTTKENQGTGLGLAICYRIMEQHRGQIRVDSELDKGTTFTLQFPPDYSQTRHDGFPTT